MFDVLQARSADFGSFGAAAEPAGAGQVWAAGEAGQQRDAVAFQEAAVGSAGNVQPQERHGPDVAADLAFDVGFLAGALAGRAVAVKPGGEQVIWQAVAADEGCADMPTEHRCTMVAAARVAAGQLPAMLPEPTPQRGLAGFGKRVGADAHHPRAVVRAVLAVFVEEVEALERAAGPAGALTQVPWPAELGGQPIQDPVELIDVGSTVAVCAVTSEVLSLRNRLPSVLWSPWPRLTT